ncbi:MAG: DUF1735 and LamG domain-containing protein [Bacteroidaceae bacterium]
MKNKIQKISMWLMSAAFIFGMVSCNDAEYTTMSNAAYLSEAQTLSFKKVTVDDKGGKTTITVRTAAPVDADTKLEIVYDVQAVENFNKRNGTNYLPLPEDSYELGETEVTILKGKVSASMVNVKLAPFSDEMMESGSKYALPLSVKVVTGDIPLLDNAKSVVYILDQVIITSVPIMNRSNNFVIKKPIDELILDAWTIEFRLNISMLGTEIGQMNNQAIFGSWGPDSEIFFRFGDAPIKGNIFQVKTMGSQLNSIYEFNPKQWYHIAIVNDGTKVKLYVDGNLDSSMDSPGKQTVLNGDLGFGNNNYLKADVMLSEFRLWNVARTQAQLQNNMFAVSPKSPDLTFYFKFNEGEGNDFTDATGHGYIGSSKGNTQWVHGIRSDQK